MATEIPLRKALTDRVARIIDILDKNGSKREVNPLDGVMSGIFLKGD